jgi:anti-sigma-K factor RskA
MNTRDDDRFDQTLRAHHAASLAQLSARTRAQLQVRTRAVLAGESTQKPMPVWRLAWPVAVACAVGAVVLGVQIRGLETSVPQVVDIETPSTSDASTAYASLEENPDLYVWLASDGAMLAME